MEDKTMKEKKEGNRTHQLKFNIDEETYERGMKLREKGYYRKSYEGEFWAYVIWLGANTYEAEVLASEKTKHDSILPTVAGELPRAVNHD